MTESDGYRKATLRRVLGLWDDSEKTRFLIVGAWNTVFGYLVFIAAYFLLHRWLHYLVIMLIAHFISVCNAFVGYKFLVFRGDANLPLEFLRFNVSYLGPILFGLVAMPVMVEILHLHPVIAQGVIIVVTAVLSYLLHKKVSFRQQS
jgi:putative flippase GtrA